MGYQALPCRRATRIRPLNVPALLERFSSKPSKSENVTKVCLAQISLFKWRIIFQFTEERVVLCFKWHLECSQSVLNACVLRAGPSSPHSTPACRVEALGPPALILRSPMSCGVSFIKVAFSFSLAEWLALRVLEAVTWLRWWRISLQCGRPRFDPWVGKIPWRREWQSTTVFFPGKFHEQRSLVGYSSWVCKEPDTTEWLTTNKEISGFGKVK